MNKSELKLLEKAFAAQLPPRKIPVIQPWPSKALDSLVALGYLQISENSFGDRFHFVIKGYELTLLGHMAYCHSCKDFEAPS
jgi:hypothetical protein